MYKVIKNTGERRVSAVAYGLATVTYIPDLWVQAPNWLRRKGYHLCVFTNFTAAIEFASGVAVNDVNVSYEVWECKVGEVKPLRPYQYQVNRGKLRAKAYTGGWTKDTIFVTKLLLTKCLVIVETGGLD